MNKNMELKQAAVAEIAEKLQNCKSMVVAQYNGLTVAQVTELRKQCREADVQYCVLKNRLVVRALEAQKVTGIEHLMEGPNAFIFSMKDAVSGPKVLSDYIEKNKLTSLTLRGGVMDGAAMDEGTVKKLAALPGRDVLLGRFVGSLNSTIGNFARAIEAVRKQKAGE